MNQRKLKETKDFLDEMVDRFNRPGFIEADPVSVPHRYSEKADIEISGFLAAAIAWGRRDLILRSCTRMLGLMDNAPYDFVSGSTESDLRQLSGFVHRTFNGKDFIEFIRGLKKIYAEYDSLEMVIAEGMKADGSLRSGLAHLRVKFFEADHEKRAEKHLADVRSGAAGKRLFMFLRIIKVAINQNILIHPVSPL